MDPRASSVIFDYPIHLDPSLFLDALECGWSREPDPLLLHIKDREHVLEKAKGGPNQFACRWKVTGHRRCAHPEEHVSDCDEENKRDQHQRRERAD